MLNGVYLFHGGWSRPVGIYVVGVSEFCLGGWREMGGFFELVGTRYYAVEPHSNLELDLVSMQDFFGNHFDIFFFFVFQ